MKHLRFFYSVLVGLVMAFALFAPAEAHALLPTSVDELIFGAGGVTMAAGGFVGLSRQARGMDNLGGIAELILFAETDFTAEWPAKADVTATGVAVAPPLKTGVVGAVLKFDRDTCRVKSARKGDLGYQSITCSGEAKFAGYEADQIAALEKTFNEGGVAIAKYRNGKRVVLGTSTESLTFTDETDSGAKGDDKNQIDFKFTGGTYSFHPPVLATSVVIPLPV